MTRHKHADLMIAYANNKNLEVQFRMNEQSEWCDVEALPGWLEDLEYRIKPKQAKKGDLICEIDGVKWWLGPESEEEMTWQEAKEWCEQQGCVLPSREVLLMCFIKEDIRKQFKTDWYWSGDEYSENPAAYAWVQFFNSGGQDDLDKTNTLYVRGVISS